jgi:hypothetical protein
MGEVGWAAQGWLAMAACFWASERRWVVFPGALLSDAPVGWLRGALVRRPVREDRFVWGGYHKMRAMSAPRDFFFFLLLPKHY